MYAVALRYTWVLITIVLGTLDDKKLECGYKVEVFLPAFEMP